ncbi:MAG: ABC transporter substrate-binding protein, partial [candidate division NC10 bacterium]
PMRRGVVPFGIAILILGVGSCAKGESRSSEIVTAAVETNPVSLDPRVATDALSLHVDGLLFNGLVRADANFRIVPDLAERWEQPDERTYVFHLRRGVRFHHGRELTAEDVRFTFESLKTVGSAHAAVLEEIREIQVLDRQRVAFHLKRPFAPILYHLTIGIVPSDLARQEGFGQNPVGTGPFRFKRWVQNEWVEVEAFPDYFGGKPKIGRLRFRIIPEATIRFLELKKGTIDVLLASLPPEIFPLVVALPGVEVAKVPSSNYTYVGFNLEDPILSNLRVRRAIAHAIDREGMMTYLLRGQAIPATGLLSPQHWAYESHVETFPFDPEKARRLLDEAGYPMKGRARFTLTFKATTNEISRTIAEAIQYQLSQVGIALEIRSYEFGTFYKDIKSGNFQLYILTWVGITSPDFYHYIFHSDSWPPRGANRGRYQNAEVDRLLLAVRRTSDLKERMALYSRVQRILAKELPYVSLWHEIRLTAYTSRVRGFSPMPGGDFTPLKDIYIDDRQEKVTGG